MTCFWVCSGMETAARIRSCGRGISVRRFASPGGRHPGNGQNQTAAAQFTTVAPLQPGAVIIIEWQQSVTGSSEGSASYLFTRTLFPDICPDDSVAFIDRTLVANDGEGVVTTPTAGVTIQPTYRLIAV
ncbi:hypothetical protein HQQ81_21160 [Microbacteriaceae bacterium VKM Ac-2854]|nr:hypothetical protein [Microbacteriaceae bacterium VKM Ac-2854]